MPRVYSLPPEAFEEEKARLLRSLYAVFLMALAAGTMVAIRDLDFNSSAGRMLWSISVLTVCVLFSMSAGFWAIFHSLRARRRAWDSYRLRLEDERIIRTAAGYPDIELRRDEVREVRETARRGLMINSHMPGRFIFIPASLSGYDELKNQLAGWLPLAPARQRDPLWRSPFFVGAVCLAGWSVLYFSENHQYIVLAAFVLMTFLIATYITVLSGLNVSATDRRLAWTYLLAAGMVLLKLYQVFGPLRLF